MGDRRKPVREMDTIITRLPDGMKDRLAQRARISGRSMNSEVLSIIERALDEPSEVRFQELESVLEDINREGAELDARQEKLNARHTAARAELARYTERGRS